MLAGRKRDSPIWKYFEYDMASDKSVCNVNESDKPSCNIKLAGKNSNHLVAHLRHVHPDAHKRYTVRTNRKKEKAGVKRRKIEEDRKVETITDCFTNRIVTWSTASSEYIKRHDSVMNTVIFTGYPASMLDQPSVREMLITLDPKFKPPGLTYFW
jgi:hypothetical protein